MDALYCGKQTRTYEMCVTFGSVPLLKLKPKLGFPHTPKYEVLQQLTVNLGIC